MTAKGKGRLATPKVKLPRTCGWAVEDAIAKTQEAQDAIDKLHSKSRDPELLHEYHEIYKLLLIVEKTINLIGVKKEEEK